MTKKFYMISCIIICIYLWSNCSPKPIPNVNITDQYGCKEPPASAFTAVGIDVDFAQSKFGQIVTGDLNVKTNPEVISLAGKAITDSRISSYLRCLAMHRDGYSKEQAAYFDDLTAFISTQPSAEAFITWKKENPFPGVKPRLDADTSKEDIKMLQQEVDSLKKHLQQLKKNESSKPSIMPEARINNECESWIMLQSEGKDTAGRHLKIQINILTQEYRWVFAQSDVIENFSSPVDPRAHIKKLDINGTKGIICVGTASSEGSKGEEESRSMGRAENLLLIFREEFKNLPERYTLNLGQYRYKHERFDPNMTRDQRRVIVIAIISKDENINLEIALKDALINMMNENKKGRISSCWDFRDYSIFKLFGA